jgi:cell division septation protein DedD
MAAEERKFQDPEYDYYDDIEDEEEEGGRGPILVVVAIIVVTAFVGVVLVAYTQGVKEGRQQVPPILRADQGPVRETPADSPASLEPSKSPSTQIFSPGKPPSGGETLAPPPEEPLAPEAGAAKPALSAPSLPPAPTKGVEVKAAPEPGVAPPPAAKPAEAAPAPAPAATAGSYLVQIGSFRSDTEATATWEKIKAKNADLLGRYAPNIVSVDLGAKGTYQRLRFGPFDTREAAATVCEQLKARKQDCLLAKQ